MCFSRKKKAPGGGSFQQAWRRFSLFRTLTVLKSGDTLLPPLFIYFFASLLCILRYHFFWTNFLNKSSGPSIENTIELCKGSPFLFSPSQDSSEKLYCCLLSSVFFASVENTKSTKEMEEQGFLLRLEIIESLLISTPGTDESHIHSCVMHLKVPSHVFDFTERWVVPKQGKGLISAWNCCWALNPEAETKQNNCYISFHGEIGNLKQSTVSS